MRKNNRTQTLFQLREAKGCTQQQIADDAGLSRSYYAMMETCGRVPSVAAAQKLERVFNINWYEFFMVPQK